MTEVSAKLEDFERPTVWIVQDTGHDFTPAEEHGTVEVINDRTINRFAVAKMLDLIETRLENAKPTDYILPTGLTILSCLACAYFARRFGRLNVLLYNTKTNTYTPKTIEFPAETL